MSSESAIRENYETVRRRIEAARRRAMRDSRDVTLVAVTKYAQIEWVQALVALGVTELGESRPQQLVARAAEIAAAVHWHLIGHLQRNKVRLVLPAVVCIHSVDSVRLMEAIDRIAAELALRPRVLIEVNLTGEEAKHGFSRETLVSEWESLLKFPHVTIEGLMTMATYSTNPEDARPTFRALRELRDTLRPRSPSEIPLPQLSMGMTGDFEVAIEEGATMIRIGSALWEGA
jgi:pyridoxal phosphate enzyme (YggS family)